MNQDQADRLAAYLRSTRQARGLSGRQLAFQVGIDPATITRLEQGRILNPNLDKLRDIAGVLGVPAADLYAVADWMPKDELPSFRPYLRTKYRDLPPEAVAEIESVFDRLARDYRLEGPQPGEDEQP